MRLSTRWLSRKQTAAKGSDSSACLPFLAILLCSLIPVLCGCLLIPVPRGKRVTAGHKYSKEEIAFLDLPGATREETIATLGEPLWEEHELRVMLYLWETTFKWEFVPFVPSGPLEMQPDPIPAPNDARRWGLFVAYDAEGRICRHEVREVRGVGTPEEVCSRWVQAFQPSK